MRPLRIIFDASPLLVNKTGIAYYTERLVTSLAEQFPDKVSLVGFYYNFLGRRSTAHFPVRQNLQYKSVTFVPSKIIFQLRRWGIELPIEYLAKTPADFLLFPNFLSYPSLRGTPSAPVIHDLTFIDLPEYVSRKNRQDLARFVPKAIKRSSFVVTVSDSTKQNIHATYGVPEENILVTPVPPEPARNFSEKKRRSVLASHALDKPYILFLGTVEPRKNLVNLMDAYTALPEKIRSTYTLVIAGRAGWHCDAELQKMQELQQKGLQIKHLGYVNEETRAVLYADADLFVTASSYEGFGMPIVEAMSYGVPVAASNIPVFREVAGENARFFDQTNPEAIARTLERLLADPVLRKKMSKNGRHHARQMQWEAVSLDVYNRIVQALQKN